MIKIINHKCTFYITEKPFIFFGCKMKGFFRNVEDVKRLLKFCKQNKSGCIEWQGSLNTTGYGQFSAYCHVKAKSKPQRVYRWILQQKLGYELTKQDFACHTCDNVKCVSPFHLYKGTAMTNSHDMLKRKGHYLAKDPTRNIRSKFSPEQIRKIRKEKQDTNMSYAALGRKYNIDSSLMSKICRGLRYKHVK